MRGHAPSSILESNRALLVEGAQQLLAKETLADDELLALLRRVVPPPSVEPAVAVGGRAMNAGAPAPA